MLFCTKRTVPSPMRTLTPPECMERAGMMPKPQSWAPPGQQLPPALGQVQFGGAAVLKLALLAEYHPHIVPLLERMPLGLFLAWLPIVSNSAWVGKSRLTTALK